MGKLRNVALKYGLVATLVWMHGILVSDLVLAAQYKASLLHPPGYVESDAHGNSTFNQAGSFLGPQTGNRSHAVLWHGSSGDFADLHPAGYDNSFVNATSGTHQVGDASGQAMLWSGTAASAVSLAPDNVGQSFAADVDGNTQVGHGYGTATGNAFHALMWHGSAESFVDLNPNGFYQSFANAVDDGIVVGSGSGTAANGHEHALLWNGAADNFIDLHNDEFTDSAAMGVVGNSQVGVAIDTTPIVRRHAVLWHGTAESMVDLHPTDYSFDETTATAVSGDIQVGYGMQYSNFYDRAVLWRGTAESIMNLHQLLSGLGPNFRSSQALSVAANGDVVGFAYDDQNPARNYAILWTPVPEPSAWTIANWGLIAGALLAGRIRPW